jgi:ATP/maltotriose-dependent transcriptional regulator MalT
LLAFLDALRLSVGEFGRHAEVWAHLGVGRLYLVKSHLARAIEVLERALPLCETGGDLGESIAFAYGHALVITTLAEARLLAGDVGRASAEAARALALSRHHGQRGWEAWTRRLQGEIAARREPPDVSGAERHLRDAMALAGERGMRPLLAHCQLGPGDMSRAAGDAERARTQLGAALAEYRAMEMPYWVTRAAALSTPRIGYTGANRE